jgi:hypothetical protein
LKTEQYQTLIGADSIHKVLAVDVPPTGSEQYVQAALKCNPSPLAALDSCRPRSIFVFDSNLYWGKKDPI